MKHVLSGLLTPGDIALEKFGSTMFNKAIQFMVGIFEGSYNGPGTTLASRIKLYGIMIIGDVGNATYGCGGMIGGLFGVSCGLCDESLPFTVFEFEVAAPVDGALFKSEIK